VIINSIFIILNYILIIIIMSYISKHHKYGTIAADAIGMGIIIIID